MSRALFCAALLFVGMPGPPGRAAGTGEDFANVLERALPAIVNITVWLEGSAEGAPASEAGSEHRTPVAGTGFAIDPSGLIVTNRHVVEGASTISVGFSDRTRARATVVALAGAIDVAVLKVDVPKPMAVLKFADSDLLRVGQPVICIGNPLGIGLTVTSGVISALNRDIHKTPFDDFVQSDCAINPGNSGGPMLNTAGEVIGVDTANIDPYSGGSIGLGFALTSNDVAFVAPRLIRMGRVDAGWIGLSLQEATPEIVQALGIPAERGLIVNGIDPAGPAFNAGLQLGDVVLDVSGGMPPTARELTRVIARRAVGSDATLTVWREGRTSQVVLPIMELPGGPARIKPPVDEKPKSLPDLGFRVAPILTPQPAVKTGVVVTEVTDDSIASEAGIVVGTVIVMVQGRRVGTSADVATALRDARTSRKFVVLLLRSKSGEQRWTWLRL